MYNYYYFFDLNEKLIERYPVSIAYEIKKKDQNASFIFLYAEKYYSNLSPDKLPQNSKSFYIPSISEKKLKNLIEKYPPKNFTSIGLRLPDLLMFTIFNMNKVPTFMVQHGLFVKHLERIPFIYLLFQKFQKFIKYLKYSYKISAILKLPFLKVLHELYLYFIKGTKKIPQLNYINSQLLISNNALIFDNYWDDYYKKTYGYKNSQITYVGNPDYNLINSILKKPKSKSICYICQSLVEDGRFLKSDYLDFLNQMQHNLKGYKIYIKLHPRSKLNLYHGLKNPNIKFVKDFPHCKFYFGHYSSLLEVANVIGSKVIIWNLKNHTTPESYIKYADLITNDWKILKNFISSNIENEFKIKSEIIEYAKNGINPFELISKVLIK